MSLISEICALLDVEEKEEFNVFNCVSGKINTTERQLTRYRVDSESYTIIEYYIPSSNRWNRSDILFSLLSGDAKIVPLPFEVKYGDIYWFIRWTKTKITTECSEWVGDYIDYSNKYCKNIFRSKRAAEKHKYEVYETLTGEKWGAQFTEEKQEEDDG